MPSRTDSRRPRRAIPHVREFLADSLTPLAVYRRLASLSPYRFLFESVTGGESVSRFSFLGAAPRAIYRLYPDRLEVERSGKREDLPGEPLAALRTVVHEIGGEPGPIPFTGGLVGYFGYDLFRMVEKLPNRPADPFDLPVAVLARFDALVVFDHAHQRVLAVANEIEGELDVADAERRLARLSRLLTRESGGGGVAMPGYAVKPVATEPPTLDSASFRRAVVRAKEYIDAGDIFQVVLSQRFDGRRDAPTRSTSTGPCGWSTRARSCSSSRPPEVTLVGASPEILVRGQEAASSRPGPSPAPADGARTPTRTAAWPPSCWPTPRSGPSTSCWSTSARNDVGRVATFGSVQVPT